MFKKPSDLWGDDPEMKKAESSKQAFIPFVFPELKLLEYVIDPITKEKKVDDKGKPLTQEYNVFERFIDIIVKSPEGVAVLKATRFLDLDKIWEKSEHPQVKIWRNHIPKGKTLNLGQMFPNPYSGRKLYYGFVMFHQDYDIIITELEEKDEKGNKKKKYTRVYKTNEADEPINRLGGYHVNLFNSKKYEIEFYTCTFQLEKKSERVKDVDGNDKIVTVTGKEMIYLKSQGYLVNQKICDSFIDIEKKFLQHIETVDKTADKAYLYFLMAELKAPTKQGEYAVHTCTIDAFVLPK